MCSNEILSMIFLRLAKFVLNNTRRKNHKIDFRIRITIMMHSELGWLLSVGIIRRFFWFVADRDKQ